MEGRLAVFKLRSVLVYNRQVECDPINCGWKMGCGLGRQGKVFMMAFDEIEKVIWRRRIQSSLPNDSYNVEKTLLQENYFVSIQTRHHVYLLPHS